MTAKTFAITPLELLEDIIDATVEEFTDENVEQWDPQGLITDLNQYYPVAMTANEIADVNDPDEIVRTFTEDALTFYDRRDAEMPGGVGTMRSLEREVMLRIIDQKWRDHLAEMDYLRDGINLRAMGQQDPLVAWQREGFAMFGELMTSIDDEYLKIITHVEVLSNEAASPDLSKASFRSGRRPGSKPIGNCSRWRTHRS